MSHVPCEICDWLAYETLSRGTQVNYVPQGEEMIHHNLTLEEYLHGPIPNPEDYPVNQEDYDDEQLFPRRRDVREMVEEALHALLANSDEDGEFDRDFLTDVRDLMRAGVPFLDAVGAFAPNFDEDLSDLFPVSSLYSDYEF